MNDQENEISWTYLQGAWKYENNGTEYLDYFERQYDNADDPANNHGFQYWFKYPDTSDTSLLDSNANSTYLYLDPSIHELTFGGGMFGAKYYADVQIINNSEMIIDYDDGIRLPTLGTQIHYYRADSISFHKESWPYFIVKQK